MSFYMGRCLSKITIFSNQTITNDLKINGRNHRKINIKIIIIIGDVFPVES